MKAIFASVALIAFVSGCASSPSPAPAAAAAKPAATQTASKDPNKKICRQVYKPDKTGVGGASTFERVCDTAANWEAHDKVDEQHKRDMARAIDTVGGNGASGGGKP